MKLEDRILLAAKNEQERNNILSEYMSFVKASASKAAGRFIDESDDEFSVALIAFNEAIDRYDESKGSFLSYAALVIKSRITDSMRKRKDEPIPFSSLKNEDEEIEVVGLSDVVSDAKTEIEVLKKELESYEITFSALSGAVPRARKTRAAVASIIKYILEEKSRVDNVKKNGVLPVKEICSSLSLHKKIPERHRKYIISAIVVLSGEYEHVKPYIMGIFEGTGVRK